MCSKELNLNNLNKNDTLRTFGNGLNKRIKVHKYKIK